MGVGELLGLAWGAGVVLTFLVLVWLDPTPANPDWVEWAVGWSLVVFCSLLWPGTVCAAVYESWTWRAGRRP